MSKHLLTLLSWTGVSRTPGIAKKFPLQTLENIVQFISTVTAKADNRWSQIKTVELFSNKLLKHSNKRVVASSKNQAVIVSTDGSGGTLCLTPLSEVAIAPSQSSDIIAININCNN